MSLVILNFEKGLEGKMPEAIMNSNWVGMCWNGGGGKRNCWPKAKEYSLLFARTSIN